MFTLIDITSQIKHAQEVRRVIEQCCSQTGDDFIGERFLREVNEMSYFVRLQEGIHLSQHLVVLDQALQQGTIMAFQPALYEHEIKLSYAAENNVTTPLQDFPPGQGEVWFQALSDAHIAYICTRRSLLKPQQSAWLIEHQIYWEYI